MKRLAGLVSIPLALLVGCTPAPPTQDPQPNRPPAQPAAEPSPKVRQALEAYRTNLPTKKKLEWYTLDWVDTLGEAKRKAAAENRPILFIQTNKEGDLFCSLC